MIESNKAYGMLARDKAKEGTAFTHVLMQEAASENTARGLIRNLADRTGYVIDDARIFLVLGPPASGKSPHSPAVTAKKTSTASNATASARPIGKGIDGILGGMTGKPKTDK